MKTNGGFLVTKIKQLGDRIFEKILSEKNIDAFNGAQGRILYVLWQEDGISIRSLSTKCGLAITSLYARDCICFQIVLPYQYHAGDILRNFLLSILLAIMSVAYISKAC